MNKKTATLLLSLALLTGLAIYILKDSFQSEPIHIAYSIRPAPEGRQALANRRDTPSGKRGYILSFALDQKVSLQAVQVYPLADVLTNKYPHALWELTSDSNSIPLKSFDYGLNIRGMKPKVKGAQADPLTPGESYRVVVKTTREKAQRDFQIPP